MTRSKLQRLVSEQQRHSAAAAALVEQIDAEMFEREQAGTSQADLAREAGVDRQQVSRRIRRHKARKAAKL